MCIKWDHTMPTCLCFPGSLAGKEYACNEGDLSSIPGLRSSPREGIGHPLQFSWASLVGLAVKNLAAMQETWIQSPCFTPIQY